MKKTIILWVSVLILLASSVIAYPSPQINTTFDSFPDPWKDYSANDHSFSTVGTINYLNTSVCKWFGCMNVTQGSGNYLHHATADFEVSSTGWAASYWVYYRTDPNDLAASSSHWQIGSDNVNAHAVYENRNAFGTFVLIYDDTSTAHTMQDSGDQSPANQWLHFFIQFNVGTNAVDTYRNGVLIESDTYGGGTPADVLGDDITIGEAQFSSSSDIYMDEFLFWNDDSFTQDDVTELYNSRVGGTPPDLDLYVSSFKYPTLYNFSNLENNLSFQNGKLPINFTLENNGIQDSTSFVWNLTVNEVEVCSGTDTLSAQTEQTYYCNWTTAEGFWKGNLSVDTLNSQSEDDETNNGQKIYIPYLNRPFIHFNLTEWQDVIGPFSKDSSNVVAYDSYEWASSFACSPFSESYTGNSVDPFGKKARECSLGCMVNDYTQTDAKPNCDRAKTHILGWGNRTVTTYDNVQAIHELAHVSLAFDHMFPNLTKAEYDAMVVQYHDICQQITKLTNTRPDNDDDSEITGGNGKGFGAGMGQFCSHLVGLYSENPTMILDLDQQDWGPNIVDEWIDREVNFLRGFKNDTWSKYQERWNYKFYAEFHLVEGWFYQQRFDIEPELKEYQPAFCSMANEMISDTLDFKYNGDTIRNDESRSLRGVQVGDSNSYEDPGSDSLVSYAIITYYGLLCDDIETKQNLLWLRDQVYTRDSVSQNKYLDLYLYKQLYDQANQTAKSPTTTGFPKFMFDNANDIVTIRSSYDYSNDTVIQFDGGEERGGGHSQAQGYYVYVYGEPLIDYHQVPYEDDVRDERWKNGISLQNSTQTVEGTGGTFSGTCGNADINQYYGMSDCTAASYPADYPNFRVFPFEYGGDVEDYIGTGDANFGGAYVWRPYKNANNVQEYFIKFGDLLVKRSRVTGNTEFEGIFHNFINLETESTDTDYGQNFTLQSVLNDNVYLDTHFLWSNTTWVLAGGNTSIQACTSKTSCSGSRRLTSTYWRKYLHSDVTDTDMIFYHHWYYGDGERVVGRNLDTGTDEGVQHSNNFVVFDTDRDNNVNHSDKGATGWGLVYNDVTHELGAFNTTYIKNASSVMFQSNESVQAHMKWDNSSITLTLNTMERNPNIDLPRAVNVTLDGSVLDLPSNFAVVSTTASISSTESGSFVSFVAEPGQNSATFTITGTTPLAVPDNPPTYTTSVTNKTEYFDNDRIQINNTVSDDNVSMVVFGWNNTGVWVNVSNTSVLAVPTTSITYSVNQTLTANLGEVVGVQYFANDTAGNWSGSGILSLSITDPAVDDPPIFSSITLNDSIFFTNKSVSVNITITEPETNITFAVFSWNDTGTWRNVTNATVQQIVFEYSVNQTITATSGQTVGVRFYANDTVGNWGASSVSAFAVTSESGGDTGSSSSGGGGGGGSPTSEEDEEQDDQIPDGFEEDQFLVESSQDSKPLSQLNQRLVRKSYVFFNLNQYNVKWTYLIPLDVNATSCEATNDFSCEITERFVEVELVVPETDYLTESYETVVTVESDNGQIVVPLEVDFFNLAHSLPFLPFPGSLVIILIANALIIGGFIYFKVVRG